MANQDSLRLDLRRFPSICGEKQERIVSRDSQHPYRHIANNPGGKSHVRHYHIDGDILPRGKPPKKCDFILFNDTTSTAYLIELKGQFCHMDPEQMDSTERVFRDSLSGYKIRYRFVTGKAGVKSSSFRVWERRKPKGTVVCEVGKGPNQSYEETI